VNVLDSFRLHGRTAIVTGAAGLLGTEFVRALAEAGANVVAADLDEPRLRQTAAAWTVHLDATLPDSVQSMFDRARSRFGRIDVLVNSAAVDPKFDVGEAARHAQTFEDLPVEAWNRALAVNLTGMFLCCQAAARAMQPEGRGSIINIGSTYGLVGPDQRIYQHPGEPTRLKPAHYSASKAGVLGLTRYLATYFAGTDIRVNALTPGGVHHEQDETFVRAYSARTVLGRMARKDELNGALVFLASDASSYMTGANLVVDGGWTAW